MDSKKQTDNKPEKEGWKRNLSKSKRSFFVVNFFLMFILILFLVLNQFLIFHTNTVLGIENNMFKQISENIPGKSNAKIVAGDVELTGNITEDAIKLVISSGVPKIYGEELGISFDEAQPAIDVMEQYDPSSGALTGDDLQRYIDVAIKISCEYCCGAKSIIREDGQSACGCAHSKAMRGLAAYLITNHGTEYTNDEILRELARWKGIYFPKQMIEKLIGQLQGETFTPDTASIVLGLELPDYGQGTGETPLPSEVENLPGMVGGC